MDAIHPLKYRLDISIKMINIDFVLKEFYFNYKAQFTNTFKGDLMQKQKTTVIVKSPLLRPKKKIQGPLFIIKLRVKYVVESRVNSILMENCGNF